MDMKLAALCNELRFALEKFTALGEQLARNQKVDENEYNRLKYRIQELTRTLDEHDRTAAQDTKRV